MVWGVTTKWRAVLKGPSNRKVENHWSRKRHIRKLGTHATWATLSISSHLSPSSLTHYHMVQSPIRLTRHQRYRTAKMATLEEMLGLFRKSKWYKIRSLREKQQLFLIWKMSFKRKFECCILFHRKLRLLASCHVAITQR